MRISVNTRLLLKDKLEGIGNFTMETLKRMCASKPEVEFYFLFDRPYSQEFIFTDNITPVVVPPPARHPVLYYLWFEWALPRTFKKIKPDVHLSPDAYLSLRTDVKQVQVIHDLNFEHYPKDLPWVHLRHYKYYFPRYAKKAARIATVSEYSKQDIVNLYNIDADKIDVTCNGSKEAYKPLPESEQKLIKEKYANGSDYFFFVGSLHPRKNLANLFKAYDLFKKRTGSDTKLMIIGERFYWTGAIQQAYEGMEHKDDVMFSGRVQPESLSKLYASSKALTYVSYFEGFGIPILEAFNSGCPVITSNVTSMPEIAGDAALLVDPFSIESITDALTRTDKDEELRKSLIAKGYQRKDHYTWEMAANKLWNTIEKVL